MFAQSGKNAVLNDEVYCDAEVQSVDDGYESLQEACLAAGLPQAATASRKLADAGFEALDENIAILATTIDQLHDSLPFKVSTDDLYTEPFEQERPKSIPVPIAETTIEVSPATVPAPAPVDEPGTEISREIKSYFSASGSSMKNRSKRK